MGIEKISSEGTKALRKIISSIDKAADDTSVSFKNGINKEEFVKNINTAGGGKLAKEAELLFGILNTGGGDTLDTDELSIIQDKEGGKTSSRALRGRINDLLLEKNPDLKKSGSGSYTFDGKKDASDAVKKLSKKAVTLPKDEQMKILKEYLGIDTDKNDAGEKDAFYKKKLKDGSVEFYRVVNDNGQNKIIHTIMKGKEASSEVFDLKTKPSASAAEKKAETAAIDPLKNRNKTAAEVPSSGAENTEPAAKKEAPPKTGKTSEKYSKALNNALSDTYIYGKGIKLKNAVMESRLSNEDFVSMLTDYKEKYGKNPISEINSASLPKSSEPDFDYKSEIIPYIHRRLTEAANAGNAEAQAILKENEDIFKQY